MNTLKPLYHPSSWFLRLALLSAMLLLASCVPDKDGNNGNGGSNSAGSGCHGKGVGNANSGSPTTDNNSHDNDSKNDCTATSTNTGTQTATATSTATSSTTATATNTVTATFPDLPGRTCTVDRFQQQGGDQYVKKVDILFVMDHSGSMDDDWQRVATNIENLVKELPANTDTRFAVILGDVGTWSGRLYSPFNVSYLDNQKMTTTEIAQALQKTFAAGMKVSDDGSGEALFYSLYKAVTTNAAANQKAGFFRPDAGLSILFMSDEQEIGFPFPSRATLASQGLPYRCDESFEDGIKKKYYDDKGINMDVTYNAVKALKGEMPLKMHGFINITKADLFTHNSSTAKCLYDSIGYGYSDIVNKSKGVLYSIQADKAAGLSQCGRMIAQSLVLQHDFPLSKPAAQVDPVTILAAVDGTLVDGTYNAAANSEHLENAGVANSVVQIRYCAPDGRVNWNLTGFAATPSQTSVALNWATAEYATNGRVMWGTSASALNNQADDANKATNHAVTVSGLSPNTLYYFQAISWDEFGQQKASAVISARTNPDWSISGVAAQSARTTASLQWNTAEYATKGHVVWGSAANALTQQSADTATVNAHSVSLSGLAPATTYYFQCVSSDEYGLTKTSAVQSFTTQADWGISGFAGTPTRSAVSLSWATEDELTTGAVLWGTTPALGHQANEGVAAAHNHALTVGGLSADTDYYFQALGTDANGQQKASNVILVHTNVDWAITGFAGVSTQTSVTVSWTTPGYNTSGAIAWGTDGTSLNANASDAANGTSHAVTVNGLTPDTVYYFQASSTDADGIQKASTVVAIRTQALPLPNWSIANFAGTATTNSVTLSWDTAQYATTGAVLWGDSLASVSTQVNDTVTGTHHSVIVTGLQADTIYYFQALAADDRGQNQGSDVIQVRTMANVVTPPSNWTIVGFDGTSTDSQVNLIWTTPGAPTKATVKVGTSANDLSLMSLDVNTFADVQQIAIPGLNPSTQYFFQVVATDTAGRTVESVVIMKTTKAQ